MAARSALNVQHFPRPPLLEKVSRHIKITWGGNVIADTRDAYWVLETHHPPTYYLPRESVNIDLVKTQRVTFCEWKGAATYYAIRAPGNGRPVVDRIWSYMEPTRGFEPVKGHLSFYAGPWDCFVDGEKVEAQPGDFYGGWVTSDIEGIVKGRQGNFDPVV